MSNPRTLMFCAHVCMLTVVFGCNKWDEIQKSRVEQADKLAKSIEEVSSETVSIPDELSDKEGIAAFEASLRASNLLFLYERTLYEAEDLAAPYEAMRRIPVALRNLAESQTVAEAKSAIEGFAEAIEGVKGDLESLAADNIAASSNPDQMGVPIIAGLAVNGYLTKTSVDGRYEEANRAAAIVKSQLEERFGVPFPLLIILSPEESERSLMSDDEFINEAEVQFWEEAGKGLENAQ